MYSGKQVVSGTSLIISSKRSVLLRRTWIGVFLASLKHKRSVQIERHASKERSAKTRGGVSSRDEEAVETKDPPSCTHEPDGCDFTSHGAQEILHTGRIAQNLERFRHRSVGGPL